MGEKGNVADVAAVGMAGGAGAFDTVASGAGSAVDASTEVALDVADSTRGKLVDTAADHLIDEGRDRLRKDPGAPDVDPGLGNAGSAPPDGGPAS